MFLHAFLLNVSSRFSSAIMLYILAVTHLFLFLDILSLTFALFSSLVLHFFLFLFFLACHVIEWGKKTRREAVARAVVIICVIILTSHLFQLCDKWSNATTGWMIGAFPLYISQVTGANYTMFELSVCKVPLLAPGQKGGGLAAGSERLIQYIIIWRRTICTSARLFLWRGWFKLRLSDVLRWPGSIPSSDWPKDPGDGIAIYRPDDRIYFFPN